MLAWPQRRRRARERSDTGPLILIVSGALERLLSGQASNGPKRVVLARSPG